MEILLIAGAVTTNVLKLSPVLPAINVLQLTKGKLVVGMFYVVSRLAKKQDIVLNNIETISYNNESLLLSDKIPWTQVSDLKGWKNEVSTYYGIQGIPSNYLVDPNGLIIARNLRGDALQEKLKELMK